MLLLLLFVLSRRPHTKLLGLLLRVHNQLKSLRAAAAVIDRGVHRAQASKGLKAVTTLL
jgi:hypothetical protein